jgi:ubiquinone/menaquinone biosynthesis C-methylase UbiE
MINLACGTKPISRQRQKVVPQARGKVLEIGMGSGLNLPFYQTDQVEKVWGLEPSAGMRRRARDRVAAAGVEVEWLDLPGEQIPLDDGFVDTVVLTYTLCTIPDATAALQGMRRVLKPGGQLLFCEHGEAPDPGVAKWQRRLNSGWRRCFGGCNLNRRIPTLIEEAGFSINELDTMYLPGSPRALAFNYWGVAD